MPAFVQFNSDLNNSANAAPTYSLSFDDDVTEGDLLLFAFYTGGNTIDSVTDTLGTTYTQVAIESNVNLGGAGFALYAGYAAASGANAIAVTMSASSTIYGAAVAEFSGVSGAAADSTTIAYASTSALIEPAALTTAFINLALLFGWQFNRSGSGLPTPGTGYTLANTSGQNGNVSMVYNLAAPAGNPQPSMTCESASYANGVSAAFGTPPPPKTVAIGSVSRELKNYKIFPLERIDA